MSQSVQVRRLGADGDVSWNELEHELVGEKRRPHGHECSIQLADQSRDRSGVLEAQGVEWQTVVRTTDRDEPGGLGGPDKGPPAEEPEVARVEDATLVVIEAPGRDSGSGIPVSDVGHAGDDRPVVLDTVTELSEQGNRVSDSST